MPPSDNLVHLAKYKLGVFVGIRCGAPDTVKHVPATLIAEVSCPACQFMRRMEPGSCDPPALKATDDQLEGAGWSRSLEEHESKHGTKAGKAMAKKNGNGEANGDGKQVKTQRLTRTLPVELKPEELATRADRQSHLISERDAIVDEAKAANKHAKARVEEKDAEIRKTATEIRDRRTYQAVECEERFMYRTGKVVTVRLDSGEQLSERAMSASERQTELPGVDAGKPGDADAKPEGKKRGRRKASAEQQEASPAE